MVTKRNPNAYDIYQLGRWLAQLRSAAYVDYGTWGMVRVGLVVLIRYKNVKGLEFIGLGAEMHNARMSKEYNSNAKLVSAVDRKLLEGSIMQWYGRLDEVAQRWILSLPDTHMDIGKLNIGAKSFLAEGEWNMLQPLEQHGLNEAALCILSNTFTSAEFIALRTAESLLRRWYEKKTGNKLEREKWGEILEELNELYPKKSQRPKELSLLDYLRGRRNEIAHPDVISNTEQATATFLNVIAVCKAVKGELLG
jgi:hypothetical protein